MCRFMALRELKLNNDNDLGVVTAMAGSEKVRVPNPRKPRKERLDAPPAKPHRNRKKYRRRPKHPARQEGE
jgi:hypothetical protein